jgi:heme-degrading monooxygenase HmoA
MQHVVLFHFPTDLSEEDEREMAAMVREWPANIPGFTKLRFGKDASGRSRGYQYLLLTEFESNERMQAYFPHPVHRAFADWIYARGCEVLAADYPVNEASLMLGD